MRYFHIICMRYFHHIFVMFYLLKPPFLYKFFWWWVGLTAQLCTRQNSFFSTSSHLLTLSSHPHSILQSLTLKKKSWHTRISDWLSIYQQSRVTCIWKEDVRCGRKGMERYMYSLVWYGHSKVALRNIVCSSLHENGMVWHSSNTMMLWYGVWILWPTWYGMTGHYSVI